VVETRLAASCLLTKGFRGGASRPFTFIVDTFHAVILSKMGLHEVKSHEVEGPLHSPITPGHLRAFSPISLPASTARVTPAEAVAVEVAASTASVKAAVIVAIAIAVSEAAVVEAPVRK
jgi:hypothetical protein